MEIYLDNAATTQPLPGLEEIYREYLKSLWYNASALYAPSVQVSAALSEARETLLLGFRADGHKCFFTGSGTEGANTVVLKGAPKRKGMNYVCAKAEHPCVEQAFWELQEQGVEVRFVKPESNGYVEPEKVVQAVDDNTALVSVVHVNNETGARNNIESIAALVKAKNSETLFHSDGVQAYLKEGLKHTGNIDYYTVSAHKLNAHKGTGAVFCKNPAKLKPYILGGGQEMGLRSGTQNNLGILSFKYAAEYYMQNGEEIRRKYASLKNTFLSQCLKIEDVVLISPEDEDKACAHIVSIAFPGATGQTLMHALEGEGIIISTGAACSSKKGKERLKDALCLGQEVVDGMVRISFSYFNTEEEVLRAVEVIEKNVKILRRFKRS